ncbi:unnamed protein product [Closterium sp. Yama58-4]|nr:unnamed protein product [Closterium sp. Yama58-4]
MALKSQLYQQTRPFTIHPSVPSHRRPFATLSSEHCASTSATSFNTASRTLTSADSHTLSFPSPNIFTRAMARLFEASQLLPVLVLAATVALLASAPVADGVNYAKSGLDWEGVCASGERQSPINIVMDEARTVTDAEKFHLDYDTSATTATVVNKGHTVQVVPNPSNTYILHIASGTYELKQVHVHAFSEHAINGLFAPMEAHFVHAHIDNPSQLAVVGIMLRLQRDDQASPWVDAWLPQTPSGLNATAGIDVSGSFWREMMDLSMGFWRYPGSLTTPGCDEIVEWHVLRKAKFLSVNQAATFMNLMGTMNKERTNNRLPEPLHGRELCSPTVLPCRRHTLPHTLPLVDVAVPHASPHRRPRFFPLSITLHSVVDHALPPVTHASPHCRLRSHPPSLSHFPPPSPSLSATVAHAFPYRCSRSLLPSPTLPHTVARALPHLPSRFPAHHPRFPPPSRSLPPTVAHAFPHRRARFLPPSPTLSPTVALASSHRRPRFPPPSPTLHLTVAHASSHRRPRFPPPSPTLPLTVAHASPHCRPWQVVVRLWSRVLGAQPGQRVQAGSKECSAAGGCRPPLPLSSSLPPSIPHSLPHYPLSPFCCPFSLPSSRPPFLPFSLSSSSLDPVPLSLSISLSPTPFLTPTLLLRSTHPLIRPSSHPPILSSAHPLIRPSSLRRPHCLPLSLHSLPPSPTLPPHPCTLLSFSLILPSPRSSLIPCHTFTSLTFSHPPFLQASLLPTTLPPTLSFILLPLHPAALFFKLPSSDIPILRLSV